MEMVKTTYFIIKNVFHDTFFLKNLIMIALPIVIQNLIASSINMLDTLMIGKVGETEIAAVGIANQFFFLFDMFIVGIFSGCSIFISQFWGKKDTKNIRKVLGVGLIIATLISFVFMTLAVVVPDKIVAIFNTDPDVIETAALYLKTVSISYLFTAITFGYNMASRSIGNTILPMIVSFISLVCNGILNYMLIFGNFGAPSMGVVGAAIATTIARIVEFAILVWYIYKTKNVLAVSLQEIINISKEFADKVINTIIPVVLNELCWGLGTIVYSIIYGRIGKQAIASVQICSSVQNLFMVITFGFANAATVMIGNKVGKNDIETGKIYAKRFAVLSFITGIILGTALFASSKSILSFFSISKDVFFNSLMILYFTSVILPIRIFNTVLIVGILRGGGDTRFSLIAEAFTMWFIGVPLAFIGAFYWKLLVYYVAALATVEEIIKFTLGYFRLSSNKWIQSVINDFN